jgi:Pyruvate/2-oxoacid:ferredoxin oxidoreductase delta subunit
MRDACNRAQLDAAVGINSVERFLGDEALRKGWQVPVDAAPTGKRVLVVGAGAVRPIRRLPPHPAWPLRGSGSRRRITTFEEVTGGLDESTALFEARRCMSCGNCFGCDNCYGVCPDNAIVKLGTGEYRYEIDYDYCKGCGLCAA